VYGGDLNAGVPGGVVGGFFLGGGWGGFFWVWVCGWGRSGEWEGGAGGKLSRWNEVMGERGGEGGEREGKRKIIRCGCLGWVVFFSCSLVFVWGGGRGEKSRKEDVKTNVGRWEGRPE